MTLFSEEVTDVLRCCVDETSASYQLALVCCNIIACILVHVQPGSEAQWSDTGDVFSYRSDTGDVD